VRRRELLLIVGRAVFTLSGRRVPTDLGADPTAAPRTLVEVLATLGHGRLQSLVVGLAADGALQLVGGVSGRRGPPAEDDGQEA
jgi:hypothetical protein